MVSFKPEYLFTKGIASAEFYDPADDSLLGFSEYVTDFALKGSMNTGEVSGGPGNMLVMCIPDTARLSITARTADSALDSMALAVGAQTEAGSPTDCLTTVTATGTTISLTGAVAGRGACDGAKAYILGSTGTDAETVRAASGTAYAVVSGVISGFTAVAGSTYLVKYSRQRTDARTMSIPALFSPRVVRAHFSVNCYAKKTGRDVMASSLCMIRHYYIPCYYFTGALNDTLSQTATGSVDLSGICLASEDPATGAQVYGYIVDEPAGDA